MTKVNGILRVPRRAALIAIAALVAAASLASFAESYRGLYDWSREHRLNGMWAVIWPLQVDVFIAVGELALFVALADQWQRRSRLGAWAVTGAGLAVSVAGNVGHVGGHIASHVTAAVPPLAAASALAVGLGVLKRVVETHSQEVSRTASGPSPDATASAPGDQSQDVPADVPVSAPETVPADGPRTVPQPASSTPAKPARNAPPSAARKPPPSAVKRMSGADLAPYVGTLLEANPGLSQADVMRTLRVGREKAGEALRLARRDRLQAVAR